MQPKAVQLRQIGPYRIEGMLGRGGMGVVYRARHAQSGALVALKTVRVSEPGRLSQIRREALALERLDHPGVVRVLGHGVDAGVPWYVMELLEGRTLSDLLADAFRGTSPQDSGTPTAVTLETHAIADESSADGGDDSFAREADIALTGAASPPSAAGAAPPPLQSAVGAIPQQSAAGGRLPELLGIAHHLCEALAYLHGEGVVHRDVKPSNVFVTPSGQPILVDFGLAVQVGDSGGREVLAAEVTTGGSARYMAPEQIRGESLDPRCDLYAFGCVLFELISGRTPFIGLLGEVIDQHQRRPAPQLGSLVRDVPLELERLVRRLLAKDRRDRLGYAHDVSTILARAGAAPPPWLRRAPRARTYLYRPPLVGRHEVLREFERLYRRLPAAHGGVVFLRGESGVGKTRCALELAANATRTGIEVIVSGCTAGAGESRENSRTAPLEPLRPWLRKIADLCIEGGERETARWLGASAPLLAEFEPTFAQFVTSASEVVQLPAAAARAALYRSLIDLLRMFTASVPLMLIIDDLQWSDELTLGFLQRLAALGLHDMRLIVLGLVRSDETIEALRELMQHERVRSFDLPRLNHEDVGRMVAGMLSLDEATREFVQFLSEKSEGNAFFVAEYLRIAVAEQVLIRNDLGQWCLAESTEPTQVLCESLPLPQSLRELVARRTADLGPSTRALMLLAATVGRHVDVGLLRRAAGISDDEVLEAVTDLVQRHVLESVADGSGFRFVHDKLREIPYAELPNEQRKQLHRRVALALEAPAADGGEAFPEPNSGVFRSQLNEPAAVSGELDRGALGQHWLLAGEPARAISHLHAAGDAAQRMSALDQTVTFYRAALGALADAKLPAPAESGLGEMTEASIARNAERAIIDEKLADVLALLGRLEESREVYEDALDACERGDSLGRARLLRKLGKTWETSHHHPLALEAYAAAEAALTQLAKPDPDSIQEHAQLQLNRVWIHYWLADVERMRELLDGIADYVERDAPALTRSNYFGALVKREFRAHRYRISDPIIEHARSCLRAAEEAKAPVETAFARFDVGFALLFAGQIDAAEVELNGALVATRRLGDTTSEIRCLTYITLARRLAQAVQDTEQLALETMERATRANMNDYVGLAESCLGWVEWKRGHNGEALRLSLAALDRWAGLSFPYPFQWSGALTVLAIQVDRAPLRQLVQLGSRLLLPALAKLPDPIDAALASAVAGYEAGDRERTRDALERAIASASALGFI